MAHLYFCKEPGPYAPGAVLHLDGDEAHHASRVARLTVGQNTLMGDGQGHHATVRIESVSGRNVTGVVLEASFHPVEEPRVWLAQALAKGDRDEMAIQTATELGVFGVIPVRAQRSVSQWRGDKVASGVARWKKIVTQASKQSLRAWVPEVWDPVAPHDIAQALPEAHIIVLDPDATTALSGVECDSTTPIVIVVGPEGGFDAAELEALEKAGATRAVLGETVLRTSSAGPAALAIINMKVGRW